MSKITTNINISSSGSGNQNLQQVTDVGSTTTNSIVVNNETNVGMTITSQTQQGLEVITPNNMGIVSTSTNSRAILATSENDRAIHAISTNNYGVFAQSTNSAGVVAQSTNSTGVVGQSTDGIGTSGYSEFNIGVVGGSYDFIGGEFSSTNSIGIDVYSNGPTVINTNLGEYSDGIVINSGTASTGRPIYINKNNVEKLSVDQDGNINANSFVKSGGTSAQFLMADGSVNSTLINAITGYGTANYIPKFTGTGNTLGNSYIQDSGSLVTITNPLTVTDINSAGSGSLIGSVLNINQTWNTTASPTAIKLNVTNTTSGTTSKLLDLQVNGVSKGYIDVSGSGNFPGFTFQQNGVYSNSFRNFSSTLYSRIDMGDATKYLSLNTNNTEAARVVSTGNVILQTGGTFTDDGINKLQVNGYVKATGYKIPSGTSAQFLMADGSTSTGSSGGDMLKSVYDTDNTGVVDNAEAIKIIGRNSTGATLYKGTVVYLNGATGNRPNFAKAQANAESTSAGTFGVIVDDLANNTDGYCIALGYLDTLDTRTNATNPFTSDTLAAGDTIYLSPTTAGYITNIKPSAPNHLVYLGKVTRTSPTVGTIVYRVQNGY